MDDEEHAYVWGLRTALLYRVQLSTLYHQKRERFFDFCDKLVKAVAIFGGSAAFSKLTAPDIIAWIGAAVTLTSTMSLVFGLSDKSKRHAELSRNFRNLEGEIVGKGERDFTEADIAVWAAKERSLEASEPPALGALVVACQNEMALAAGQAEKIVALPLIKRLTKDIFDWRLDDLKLPSSAKSG